MQAGNYNHFTAAYAMLSRVVQWYHSASDTPRALWRYTNRF